MREDASRKDKPSLQRARIHGPDKTTAGKAAFSCIAVDSDLSHVRQIDHHSVIASAESGEAVTSTTHGREYFGSRSHPNRSLDVGDVSTTGDQTQAGAHHTVPNASPCPVQRILATH